MLVFFVSSDLLVDCDNKKCLAKCLKDFPIIFLKICLKTPLQPFVVTLLIPQNFTHHLHFASYNFSLSPLVPKEKRAIAIIVTSPPLDAP
jgi:hypothetical protein